MRKPFSSQQRFDCRGACGVQLNLECRDEFIPILAALQHIYSQPETRDAILNLVAEDVNQVSRDDVGREGMDDWQILVLAAVRLGCNLSYDKLQDLAEQHRYLRHMMGIGDWSDATDFSWRRIHDNVCLVKAATIEKISHLIVAEGHRLESAIGALQSGNGLERSRDRTEPGFERYVMLGILGRNLHVLGKLVIAHEANSCEAARSKRGKSAA